VSAAPDTYEQHMRRALDLAEQAAAAGEVPVGAVVVLNGEVVGEGFNRPIAAMDPTAHAEVVAMREAAARVGNYRLSGATLVVTLEPCLMCVGAMVHARIGTVVYGTPEPRSGGLGSAIAAHETPGLNHRVAVVSGVLEGECRRRLQEFFRARRGGAAQLVADPL